MKKLLLAISMMAICNLSFSQNFSGKITREIRIIPKVEGLEADSILANEPGDRITYLIKDGYYKSAYWRNGEMTYGYTYRKGEHRMYDEDANTPYITWRDSRIPNDTISDGIIYKDSTKMVMGHECFLVKTEREGFVSYNYYAKDLRVKYDNFKEHAVGNWYNNLVALEGAQLLMSIEEYESYTKISKAVDLDIRRVKNSEFNLPDKPVFASYQALNDLVDMGQPTEELIKCYGSIIQSYSRKLPRGTEVTVYLSLIVKADGTIDYVAPVEEDEWGLYKGAMEILESCNLPLIPGKIAGVSVSSETYFPVTFKN